MKTFIISLCALAIFGGCTNQTIPGSTPAATTGQDLNSLATQVTQAWVDYKAGNVNYAWAISHGLFAYQTIIKSESDFKAIVAAWGGGGTLSDKLARIFASSSAPPAVKTAVIANAVQNVAAAKP